MGEVEAFGLAVLVAALTGIAAVLSSRVSERLRIPAPAFFLIGAAAASDIWPRLGSLGFGAVEQVVTVALAVILFDGGMRMGWRRFRPVAVATVWIGVAGTLVTAAAAAVAAHFLFSFGWRLALLLGTALAPTDPAVVFSVLGRREIGGRSGVLLQGESGANDPVGIALLVALLTAAGTGLGAAGHVAEEFALQMAVGIVAGVAGGWALLVFMRRVPLPSEGLYPLRVLAGALAIYGLATVAHGSGFLAVFIAGILIGDERAPYKGEIARFHSSLASLAEVVAFVMLGLTIHLRALPHGGAWLIGLALAALLAFVIRPLLVGAALWPVRLRPGERVFVLWTGLKGAVPILLGAFIVQARITGRAAHLRDHLRGRGVLGHRAGRGGPRPRPADGRAAAHHRARTVDPGHPVPGGTRGPAPLHRRPRYHRRRQHDQRPAAARGRLDQFHPPRREPRPRTRQHGTAGRRRNPHPRQRGRCGQPDRVHPTPAPG